MRFISWNVNGLRACMNKGFMDVFQSMDADFFCLQETKLQEGQIQLDLPGYHQYWSYAEKKGYSGTAIFTRHTPLSVSYGLGIPELDTEGRTICLEYPEFYLVTCYTPNAQRGLARIGHRLRWEEAFRRYLMDLDSRKPVVICGDLNVAHKEIDLKNPGSNRGNAGFSDEERDAFTSLLDSGFTDTFRHLYPDKTGAYSWWSYMYNARKNNAGWRIDYFLVSDRLTSQIYAADIHPEVMGSDHCPVSLDLDTTCNGGLHIPVPQQAEDTVQEKADGDDPIGTVHFGRVIGCFAVLALLLSIPIVLFSNRDAPQDVDHPTKNQVIASQAIQGTLIHQVLDRTGILEYRQLLPTVVSSSFQEYLVCGEESWQLDGYETDTPYESSTINFHLQVIFSQDRTFYSWDKPEVTVAIEDGCDDAVSVETIRYYLEDDRIAGCFVSGCAHTSAIVELQVSYGAITELSGPIALTPSGSGPLVEEQISYGAGLSIEGDIFSPTSSVILPMWFVCGEERWQILQDDSGIYPLYRGAPNFSLRLVFPVTAQFTSDLKPKIDVSVRDLSGQAEREDVQIQVRYYVDEDGRVAGAFVYGYLSTDVSILLSVEHNSSRSEQVIQIQPDFADMDTQDLAYRVATCQEVAFYISKGGAYLQELLNESPALRELLSRDFVIAAILRANAYTSIGSNFDHLLTQEYFQSKMTEAQKLIFQSQQERGFLYEDLILAVPT